MKNYIIKRVLSFFPTMLLTVFVVFFAMSFIERDTARLYLPAESDEESIEEFNREYNLDKGLLERFFLYLKGLATGDSGRSFATREKVSSLFFSRLKNTLLLAFCSIFICIFLSIPLGSISAVKKGTILDRIASFISLIGLSIPSFWLSILLIYFFSYKIKIFPSSGFGGFKYLVLPVISLSLSLLSLVSRSVRNSMLEEMAKPYFLFLQAKGLSNFRIVYFHLLRASSIAVITAIGQQLSFVLTGSVLIESIFSYPGIGLLIYSSILSRDSQVVTYSIVMCSLMMAAVNLLVDILLIVLDPDFKENVLSAQG